MGLDSGMEGLVDVASGRVALSSGGWVVLELGACCSSMFAVNVKVPSASGVGEG